MRNPQRITVKAVAFTFFCVTFLYAGVTQAATYNVGNGDVAGLIAAITAANSSPAPNTINLASAGTYTLTAVDNGVNGLPAITNSMTINGNGATIQRSSAAGTPDFRFFLVLTTTGTVTFSGLTLSNGTGTGPASDNVLGGAISNRNSGTVNVISCVIFGNSANYGGGLENVDGTLNVINSTISGNSIRPSTDDLCGTCGGTGGGIHNGQGTVNITNSTISGNSARGGGGMISFNGTVNVTNSTISGNTATDVGGGINHFGGIMNVTNSTISGNAAANAGGIQEVEGATLIFHNSIIALNTASNGRHDLTGTATSQGNNIIGNTTGATIAAQAGDVFGVTAAQLNLGPLTNNGGSTQTLALLCNSVAIDAGDDAVLGVPLSLSTDQRSVARRVGAHVDVGAFEANTCSPGGAHTATFFATKDYSTQHGVFRYQVTPTTSPILNITIADSSTVNPLGLTLSSTGELFVMNQGTQGGFVNRFLNPTAVPLFNGNIPTNTQPSFYGTFKGNELFVVQQYSGVLRFLIDPTTGQSTPNGEISMTPTIGELRGVAVTPWGELLVAEEGYLLPTIIHRYIFDPNGNPQPNGTITDPNMQCTHGMTFSPWGELFVSSPCTDSVARFTFDNANNACYNGSIFGGGMSGPIDVSFAPWGELFVADCMCVHTPSGTEPGISRFNFDAAHVASPSGTVMTPVPIMGITFAPGPSDSTAPSTTAASNPSPNAAGWINSDVTVSLNGSDDSGGTGVRNITYSASGAQTIPATTISGDVGSIPLSAEGQTTVTYFATDNAGNTETPQTITVKIDKSAPSLSCAPANGTWHDSDVSIPCTADDALSGLANQAEANFVLSTNVAGGTETANASTGSDTVCDVAGNCSTAGPVAGNKVDKKAPTVTITSPVEGSVYVLNQSVIASYSCTDGGSGVASCIGSSATGSNIDTSSVGAKTFTLSATDNVGNSAPPKSVSYTVTYSLNVLFDQTKAVKSGSTIPIKIQLVDALGHNVSSAALVVHAVSLIQIATTASETINDAGSSNSDANFRFDSAAGTTGGYIFNLKTTGLRTGTYQLGFIVDGDPTIHTVQFAVRQ
jgi:hypothetical protein